MVKPSSRREMAKKIIQTERISLRVACHAFGISPTCYRYESKQQDENALIADWLLGLTQSQRNWGFGLFEERERLRLESQTGLSNL